MGRRRASAQPEAALRCATPLARVLEALHGGAERAYHVLSQADRAATGAARAEEMMASRSLPELQELLRRHADAGALDWRLIEDQRALELQLAAERSRLASEHAVPVPVPPAQIVSGMRVAVRTAPERVFVVTVPPSGTGVVSLTQQDDHSATPVQVGEHDVLRVPPPLTEERALQAPAYRALRQRQRDGVAAALATLAPPVDGTLGNLVELLAVDHGAEAYAAGVEVLCALHGELCARHARAHERLHAPPPAAARRSRRAARRARSSPPSRCPPTSRARCCSGRCASTSAARRRRSSSWRRPSRRP